MKITGRAIVNTIIFITILIAYVIDVREKEYARFICFILALTFLEIIRISDNLKDIKDDIRRKKEPDQENS